MTQRANAVMLRRLLRGIGIWSLVPACLLLLVANKAHAAFADLGAGARAPGMGDAFVALADDPYAIYYNPAGLAFLTRPELATSYNRHLLGLTDNSNLSTSFIGYAQPLRGGRWGTAGAAWQQFDLNGGLYQDQAIYLSYGNALFKDLGPGNLYGGMNLKNLRRSFGSIPEASNGMNGLIATGQADPVLSGRKSVSVPDVDMGFLYKFYKNYSAGLSILHVTQPNVAFSSGDTDPLLTSIKMGVNYRSILSNVATQYETRQSPIGTQDHRITLGAERWFPWLLVGNLGVRGALSLGTREFKQVSTGMTYKNRRIAVDYAFALPIGGLTFSDGTHRFSFSIRFGPLQEEEESIAMILDAMRKIKRGGIPEIKAIGPGLSPSQKVLLEEHLARTRSLEMQAQYQQALEQFSKAVALAPADTELLKSFGRLNLIALTLKQLPDYKTDPIQAAVHQGIMAYLAGDNDAAMERLSYALSISAPSRELDAFVSQMESATGLKRKELPRVPETIIQIDRLLTQAASAIEENRYNEAIALSQEVLKQQPNNQTAWENLGISYFALADYPQSLSAWEKAFAMEKSPARRTLLSNYMKSVKNILERPKAKKRSVFSMSPDEIQELYTQGLDYYSSGQLEKAKVTFERILGLDPQNVSATKALKRVKEEIASN